MGGPATGPPTCSHPANDQEPLPPVKAGKGVRHPAGPQTARGQLSSPGRTEPLGQKSAAISKYGKTKKWSQCDVC